MKRPRLPLYARALLLLALNLLLIGALFFASGGWNSLLSDSARERVAGIGERLCVELSAHAPEQWPEVLALWSARHGVRFGIRGPKGPEPRGAPPPFGAMPPHDSPSGPFPDRLPDRPPDHPSDRPPPQDAPPPGGPNDRVHLSRTGWWGPYRLHLPGSVRTAQGPRPLDVVVDAPSLAALVRFLGVGDWARLALIAAGISAALWLPFMLGVARTLMRMRDATQRIAEGHFDVRVPVRRRDELGELAASVNHMAARLERYVEGQKQFLADVAHETISPLARLRVGLDLLQAQLGAAQADTLRDVQEDAQQMSELLDELLLFSRAGQESARRAPECLDLHALLGEALAREDAGAVTLHVAPGLAVLAQRPMLLRALGNLLRNARRHGGDGDIEIAAQPSGERVLLCVRDRGPGVPDAALATLGQPFFRPDAARSREHGGYGLGLAIVRRCAQACEAELRFRNREGGGFEAELALRACAA